MTAKKLPVMIESPYRGDHERNLRYLRAAIADSLMRDEAPFAMHGFYPQFLSDDIPWQRQLGIDCGLAWMRRAEYVVFYTDLGVTEGMVEAQDFCRERGLRMEYRSLESWRVP